VCRSGICTPVPVEDSAVLVHRMDAERATLPVLPDLGREDVRVDVGGQQGRDAAPVQVLTLGRRKR
jgi:hypothetical protein